MNSNIIKTLTAAAALVLTLTGCASMGGVAGVDVLATGNHSSMKNQQYVDVHNQADFAALWAKTFKGFSAPSMPQVNFSKDMVLGAFIGEQKHTGYLIRIKKINATGATTNVTVEVTIPGTNCQHIIRGRTQPYLFVTAPAESKPVNFNVTQRNAPPCG